MVSLLAIIAASPVLGELKFAFGRADVREPDVLNPVTGPLCLGRGLLW